MRTYNSNFTTTALTIRKGNSLAVIHRFTTTTVRISAKAIFAAIALTLLNLVV